MGFPATGGRRGGTQGPPALQWYWPPHHSGSPATHWSSNSGSPRLPFIPTSAMAEVVAVEGAPQRKGKKRSLLEGKAG